MSDELRDGEIDPDSFAPEGDDTPAEKPKREAPQYSDAELKAMEKGWQPKEDFEADPKNEGKRWRDAETFLEFGDVLDQLSETRRDLRQVRDTFMQERQRAFQKGLEQAKSEFAKAVEEGDGEKAEQARQQISQFEQEANAHASGQDPAVEAFLSRNPQIQADPKLYRISDGIATGYVEEGYSIAKALELAESEVRERFPEAFGTPRRPSAPTVERGGRPARKSSLPKFSDLPENEQHAIRELEKMGMKRDDLIKQMVENGEI